mgnify:CR=1 FL=1
MEKLMEVKNLSVSYFTYAGEVQSVRGISFDVKKREDYCYCRGIRMWKICHSQIIDGID